MIEVLLGSDECDLGSLKHMEPYLLIHENPRKTKFSQVVLTSTPFHP
jgi:hypothetical protein